MEYALMAWARIHDSALNSPKLVKLFNPRDPLHLWIWGLTYAQLHLTDGAIPKEAIPHGAVKTADDLVSRRLWEAADDGYQIHDYLDWNDSRDVVTKKRSEARERMTAARARSRERSSNVLQRTTTERSPENFARSSTWRGVDLTSKEKKIENDPSEFDLRAGRLVERYAELFYQRRKGAKYHARPVLDFPKAQELVRTWDDDARLEKLAILVLTTDDEWISGTDRGFAVFASRASWADDRLAAWEAEQARKMGA